MAGRLRSLQPLDERQARRVAATLSDEARKRDGGRFKSIHGTFNHLLLADRVWLARFKGVTVPNDFLGPGGIRSLDQELYVDFEDLRRERALTDDELTAWVSGLAHERLAAPLVYMRRGQSRISALVGGRPSLQPSDPSSRPDHGPAHATGPRSRRHRPVRNAARGSQPALGVVINPSDRCPAASRRISVMMSSLLCRAHSGIRSGWAPVLASGAVSAWRAMPPACAAGRV